MAAVAEKTRRHLHRFGGEPVLTTTPCGSCGDTLTAMVYQCLCCPDFVVAMPTEPPRVCRGSN